MAKRKTKKTKKIDKVISHYRKDIKGKKVKVKGYRRKKRPKSTKIHKAETRRFEVIYYRNANGELVSKRKYKLI